jgi:hypothetical protein
VLVDKTRKRPVNATKTDVFRMLSATLQQNTVIAYTRRASGVRSPTGAIEFLCGYVGKISIQIA